MSEWWTYRLSDLLLFSPRTYFRLFELYNREVWPIHLLALAGALAILILSVRRKEAWNGRAIAAILLAGWLWVAWGYLYTRYATINWAASWFAVGFLIQALLIGWTGIVKDRLQSVDQPHRTQWIGLCLFLFALLFQPVLGLAFGRSIVQIGMLGLTPDPTATGTLGMILYLGERPRAWLLVIPILWCGISGATLWAMRSPEAYMMSAVAALAVAVAVWRFRL